MINFYKPTMYVKDIYSINYQKLKQKNIKYLLFDIDKTISANNEKLPSEKTIKLFEQLKNKGFHLIIITNAIPSRALRFGRKLKMDTYFFSCKPANINYKRIMKKYKVKKENMAAIGDQILTDIKGANKLGITSILVNPISNNESIFTKINRLRENRIIKKYKVIQRGVYYE